MRERFTVILSYYCHGGDPRHPCGGHYYGHKMRLYRSGKDVGDGFDNDPINAGDGVAASSWDKYVMNSYDQTMCV